MNVGIRTLLLVWMICVDVSSFSVPSSFLGFTNMLRPPSFVNDNVATQPPVVLPPPVKKSDLVNNRDAIALVRPVNTGLNRAPIQFKDYVPFWVVLGLATGSSLLYGELGPLMYTVDVEVMFLGLCSLVGAYQFNIPVKHEKQDLDRSWDLLWCNIFDSLPCSAEDFFRAWFFDVPFDRIRREDAIAFISWAMFSNTPEYLSAEQSTEVESILQQIERETTPRVLRNSISVAKMIPSLEIGTRRFQPRGPGEEPLRSMRHSIEPLRWVHKPFGLYIFLQLIVHTGYAKSSLLRKGFQAKKAGKLDYWIANANAQGIPLMFFHGVGGIFSYLPIVDGLLATNRPVIVIEMPYVSLHIAPNVPSIAEHISAVEQILKENSWEKTILMGHSFGTNVMSWIVQGIPQRVAGAVFLDPVCFMLHLKDVTRNWFFEEPTEEQRKIKNQDVLGIVKTELFTANAIQRQLNWFRNVLWAHEVQERGVNAYVVVSEKDKIVPSLAVVQHISKHKQDMVAQKITNLLEVECLPEAGHGDLVFNKETRNYIISKIQDVVEKWDTSEDNRIDEVTKATTPTPAAVFAKKSLLKTMIVGGEKFET